MGLTIFTIIALLGGNGHVHEHPLIIAKTPRTDFLQLDSELTHWVAMLELTSCLTGMATSTPFVINEHSIICHGYSPS